MIDIPNATTYVIWILGALSLIGNSIVIVIFLFSNIKRIEFCLVFMISVLVCINALSHMIKNFTSDDLTLCNIQASLMVFSELGISIISLNLMIHIYLGIKSDQDAYLFETQKTKSIVISVMSGIIIPIIIVIIGYLLDIYNFPKDDKLYWCWLNEEYKNYIVIGYAFIWTTIFINLFIATKIKRKLNSIENEEEKKNVQKYVGKLIIFPIISAITWFPSTFSRIYQVVNEPSFNKYYSPYSYLISAIFILGQGSLYSLLCLKVTDISKFFKKYCSKFFCSCRKSRDNSLLYVA